MLYEQSVLSTFLVVLKIVFVMHIQVVLHCGYFFHISFINSMHYA